MENSSNPSSTKTEQTVSSNPLPTITQKLTESQEISANRLRISQLEAALAKQNQKIAQIMSHIEVLKQETEHNLGDAYTAIDLMYAAIPMMEMNLRILGISEEDIRNIMAEPIEEIGGHVQVVDWVKGYAETAYENAQAKLKDKRDEGEM